MANELDGKRIAIVATDGFEQSELTAPLDALRKAGASVDVVAPKAGRIQGVRHREKGDTVRVDRILEEAEPRDYEGLVLPGGVANPDELRTNPRAISFVRAFFDAGKPVAALCQGPWTLIEADAVSAGTRRAAKRRRTACRGTNARRTGCWLEWPSALLVAPTAGFRRPSEVPPYRRALAVVLAARWVGRARQGRLRPAFIRDPARRLRPRGALQAKIQEKTMSILEALRKDHEDVKAMLEEILASGDAKRRGALFAEFKKKMTAHSRSEERVFYRPLEETEAGKEDALEGAVEHQIVDRLVAELARTRNKNADKWTARCRVLKQLVERHVEEEEGEFFETARREFGPERLDEMAAEFAREKRKYGVEDEVEPVAAE